MKIISLSLFLIFGQLMCKAQDIHYEWGYSIGQLEAEIGESIVSDNFGNIFVSGLFSDTLDFDPGIGTSILSTAGDQDIFVQKIRENGELIWCKSIGGSLVERLRASICDEYGNFYLLGTFQGTVDFDPSDDEFNLTSNGDDDPFLLKLDSDGNFIWAISFGSETYDTGYDLDIDEFGAVYVTGAFQDSVDFDPGIDTFYLVSNDNSSDMFLLKLDSDGHFIWVKSIGGTRSDIGKKVRIDNEANIYVLGYFMDTVDLDPGIEVYDTMSRGNTDIFLLKLDSEGEFIWVKIIASSQRELGETLTIDNMNNIIIGGTFSSTVDFDPGEGIHYIGLVGWVDVFMLKLSSDGDFIWAKSIGGSEIDRIESSQIDESGNIYFCGQFLELVDFDPGPENHFLRSIGYGDIYLLKLDSDGNFIYVKTVGGNLYERAANMLFLPPNDLYITGNYSEVVDFDPNIGVQEFISNGSADMFTIKLSYCPTNFGADTISACDSYRWVDDITYFSDTTNVIDTLVNIYGCDSIITLNLTFNEVNTATEIEGRRIQAVESEATYQWLDCNDDYAIIEGEINSFLDVLENGSYAVIITDLNGCIDTSNCVVIEGLGFGSFKDQPYQIYPNPSNDYIKILGNNTVSNLNIFDLNGRLIQKKTLNKDQKIDISEFNPGVYFITLDEQIHLRFVKL